MTRVPMYSSTSVDQRVDVLAAVARVVARGQYILGPEVRRFEGAFATYCGVDQCVGVASGTDALELALRALGVGSGDSVAMVANAGPYASTAARACGAQPLYVDIDAQTRTMSVAAMAEALDQRPAAIVVTHLYGQLADMAGLVALSDQAGIPLIEDCAQAHGAQRDGRRAGSFGRIGAFSFYPTKNLPALGDGGAVVTNDAQLAERVRRLRQYGWSEKYLVGDAGGRNSRLDEVQAAVLHDRLPYLDEWNERRRSVARQYVRGIDGMPALAPKLGDDFVAHLVAIETAHRDELRTALAAYGIETAVHFPLLDHQQSAYDNSAAVARSLPNSEHSCARVVSLPCFPGLTEAQVDQVLAALASFWEQR